MIVTLPLKFSHAKNAMEFEAHMMWSGNTSKLSMREF